MSEQENSELNFSDEIRGSDEAVPPPGQLRVESMVYGGDGLARGVTAPHGELRMPFVLPGEWVEASSPADAAGDAGLPRVWFRKPSPARVEPRCVHFGHCGGCQYQMADYGAQLEIKRGILLDLLRGAGLGDLPAVETTASPEPWGYRNRIRLRARTGAAEGGVGVSLQLGYHRRGSREFLPVTMCPIAAPLLWRAVEVLQQAAAEERTAAEWCAAAAEVELFCTPAQDQLQLTLLCSGKPPGDAASFRRFAEGLQKRLLELAGAGAARWDARTGRAGTALAAYGADGLAYRVLDETYWVRRGGFFQVNRFLLPRLVELVCGEDKGSLAWDLFAGVGLFSRVLARRFDAVVAVEAHPASAEDLRVALAKVGAQHRAVQATVLDFLQAALLQRERPELVVLDPPRAGAGEPVCVLLAKSAPREIRYLSCNPTTLARDLELLTRSGYRIAALHLIDLFPQTYHLETLAVLNRTD